MPSNTFTSVHAKVGKTLGAIEERKLQREKAVIAANRDNSQGSQLYQEQSKNQITYKSRARTDDWSGEITTKPTSWLSHGSC